MFAGRHPSKGALKPYRRGSGATESRSAGQWFLIGDNWSLIPLRRFPSFFILFGCLAAASLLSVAGTLHLADTYTAKQSDRAALQHRMVQLDFRLAALRQAKDLLITKTAVARQKATVAVKKETRTEPTAATPPLVAANRPKQTMRAIAPHPPLEVKDFALSHDRMNRTLTVTYKLINKSGENGPIEGRAYVVLGKPPQKVAEVHRKRRRGNRLTSGSPFSIRRFKEIQFSVGDDILEKQFQSASVIVFTGSGRVLLEKHYNVDITSS